MSSTGKFLDDSGNPLPPNIQVPPTPDPLANLPEPPKPGNPQLPTASAGVNVGSLYSTSQGVSWSNGQAGQTLNLYPGYYPGIKASAGGNIILNPNPDGSPGIYYVSGQGFQITNSANITGNNVMIYSDGTGSISLTASGSATITPPTSGTYQGMAIFQERSSNKNVSITGSGNMNIQGTFYAAGATMNVTAQGSLLNTIGSQYIVNILNVTGSGNFQVDYQGTALPTRILRLVN